MARECRGQLFLKSSFSESNPEILGPTGKSLFLILLASAHESYDMMRGCHLVLGETIFSVPISLSMKETALK